MEPHQNIYYQTRELGVQPLHPIYEVQPLQPIYETVFEESVSDRLETSWTLFFNTDQDIQNRSGIKIIGHFQSLEDLRHCSFLKKPNELPIGYNLFMFRANHLPDWQEFPNRASWLINVQKHNCRTDQMWEELLFACIGETFGKSGMTGVGLSIGSLQNTLSIWHIDNKEVTARINMGEKLQKLLHLKASDMKFMFAQKGKEDHKRNLTMGIERASNGDSSAKLPFRNEPQLSTSDPFLRISSNTFTPISSNTFTPISSNTFTPISSNTFPTPSLRFHPQFSPEISSQYVSFPNPSSEIYPQIHLHDRFRNSSSISLLQMPQSISHIPKHSIPKHSIPKHSIPKHSLSKRSRVFFPGLNGHYTEESKSSPPRRRIKFELKFYEKSSGYDPRTEFERDLALTIVCTRPEPDRCTLSLDQRFSNVLKMLEERDMCYEKGVLIDGIGSDIDKTTQGEEDNGSDQVKGKSQLLQSTNDDQVEKSQLLQSTNNDQVECTSQSLQSTNGDQVECTSQSLSTNGDQVECTSQSLKSTNSDQMECASQSLQTTNGDQVLQSMDGDQVINGDQMECASQSLQTTNGNQVLQSMNGDQVEGTPQSLSPTDDVQVEGTPQSLQLTDDVQIEGVPQLLQPTLPYEELTRYFFTTGCEYYAHLTEAERLIENSDFQGNRLVRHSGVMVIYKPKNAVVRWDPENTAGLQKSDVFPRILLVADWEMGDWAYPGGQPNGDEHDLCQTARRELEEQTGVVLKSRPTYSHSVIYRYPSSKKACIGHAYLYVTQDKDEFKSFAFPSRSYDEYIDEVVGVIPMPCYYEYNGTPESIKGLPLYIRKRRFSSVCNFVTQESIILVLYKLGLITRSEVEEICVLSKMCIPNKSIQMFNNRI